MNFPVLIFQLESILKCSDGALRSVRLRVEHSQSVVSASGRMFGNDSEQSDDLFGCAALLKTGGRKPEPAGVGRWRWGRILRKCQGCSRERHNGTKAQKKGDSVNPLAALLHAQLAFTLASTLHHALGSGLKTS
jgi:hypothetical protein